MRSEATGEGLFSRTYAATSGSFAAVMFLTGLAALAVVPTLPTAVRDLNGVSLSHAPTGRQGYASSAMQTNQNLGQITVLGIASAVFNACLSIGSADSVGYGAAFALLLAPCVLAALLATRTRTRNT